MCETLHENIIMLLGPAR